MRPFHARSTRKADATRREWCVDLIRSGRGEVRRAVPCGRWRKRGGGFRNLFPEGTMIQRVVYEWLPPRRRLSFAKVATPAIALLIAAVVVGEWACAPKAR